MDDLKLCVIGAGSIYTPALVENLLHGASGLPVTDLALMDVDRERLAIVGGLIKRMANAAGRGLRVTVTGDRRQAIEGARFVVVQIRVGGLDARIKDERIPLRFGVIGQETTGPGGFARALRTVPVMLDIADEMSRGAPDGWLVNFSNPSGLVTEALNRYSDVRAIGLCNAPTALQRRLARHFEVPPGDVVLDYFGLNHLSWVRGVRIGADDVTERALEAAASWGTEREGDLLRALRMIPSTHLRYYYFADEALEELIRAPQTKGEMVAEVEDDLLGRYQDPTFTWEVQTLEELGGADYAQAAVALMSAIHSSKDEWQVVNTANAGCIVDLPDEAVVEVPAQVNGDGAHPTPVGGLPLEVRGLVQAVKAYEELTVRAAAEGDRRAALLALMSHPLAPSFSGAQELLDLLLDAHRDYLPQFFG